MWITLVADVPDEAVVRCIEQIVQCDRDLDRTEARSQVTAGFRQALQQERSQLAGQFRQLFLVELAQVVGAVYALQYRE